MEGHPFLVISILFFVSTLTTVFASNCYGGSIVHTNVAEGSSDDYYYDITYSNNEIFAAGRTYSYDFPYDLGYLASAYSIFPSDAVLSIASTTNTSENVFNVVTGSYGSSDYAWSVDADGDFLCVTGYANDPYSFPVNTDFSYYSYGSGSVFLLVMNKTANPPQHIYSELVGDQYDVGSEFVTCSAKEQQAIVVSASGYGSVAKKALYDWDVRITFVDLLDGFWYSDMYFGGVGYDDYVDGNDYFERGTDKFLLIAGHTYSSGINDSFPIANAFQSTNNGSSDAFVWVANVNNKTNITWQFATFIGGDGYEELTDATFDESGNVYIVGSTGGANYPMKNAFDPEYCGYAIESSCLFLSVFNLQGQLLMSSWLGINNSGVVKVDVTRLSDGGHLVYIATSTYNLDYTPIEGYNYNITNSTLNYQDVLLKIIYISPQFTSGQVRFQSYFGGTGYEYAYGIVVLPNNRFAIAFYGDSTDIPGGNVTDTSGSYNAFTTIFQCGSGLYTVNPSPSPAASQPPPSPPPKTCEAQDGCYSVTGTVVQFQPGDDGQYTPSQTLFPGSDGNVEQKYYLNVEYLTLEEYNAGNNLIVSVPFPTEGYTLDAVDTVINGVNVTVVTFSNYLLNGAQVDVINYFFQQTGTLDFAGNVVTVEEGTTKVSLRISGWNFEDVGNTLTLTILLDIAPSPKGSASSTTTGNQTAFSWDTGKTSCVVTTLASIEVDDTVGTASFSVSGSSLTATFPYFTDHVLYDPGYQVLVKDDKSSSPKEPISPWAYVGAALGAVVVVSVIVAIGYVLVSRQKRRTEKALSFKHEEEMK